MGEFIILYQHAPIIIGFSSIIGFSFALFEFLPKTSSASDPRSQSSLHSLPGPIQTLTLSAFLKGVFKDMEEPFMEPQKRWWKEAGVDTPLIHWTGLFGKHFVMPLDADGVKQVLTSKQNAKQPLYMKNYAVVKRCIGDGLVTSNGSTWHRHRRIIQPAFDNKFIEKSLNAHVPMLVDTLIKSWKMKDGTDIDIPSHFSAITLDIIGKVAFSHDFQAMKSVERWASDINASVELQDPLIDALYKELMPNMFRMLLVSFNLHHFDDLIIPSTRKNRQLLNEAVAAVVKNAHSDHSQSKASGEKKKCLLELLFDAEDTEHSGRSSGNPSLSYKELQAETKTFLVAGKSLKVLIILSLRSKTHNTFLSRA